MIDLSIIIPCYNEQRNLELGALGEVLTYLEKQSYGWEIIVVDDASTDASLELAQAFAQDHAAVHVLSIAKGGKPGAIWAGVQHATGEVVLFADMDQSTPIAELEKLRPWFSRGADIVIGSRGLNRDGFNAMRQLGSSTFRGIRRALVLSELIDTQCGFKACRRDHAMRLFPHLSFLQRDAARDGWNVTAFDVELLHLFATDGLDIREVEVRWWDRDRSETKGDVGGAQRYLHESREMLAEIFRVKLNDVRGVYRRRLEGAKK